MPFQLPSHSRDALVAIGKENRTAQQLLSDAAAIARVLPVPASPGSEILVICQDRYHFAAAILACWIAGFGVALPPNGQPKTISSLSSQPQIQLVLHDTDNPEGLDFRAFLGSGNNDQALCIEPSVHLATVYTSGSTGVHQSWKKNGAQLLGEAAVLAKTFGLSEGMRWVATVPPYHIYGLLFSVLVPLLSGGAFLRETPFHAETIVAQLQKWQASVLVSVPAHLRNLQEASFPSKIPFIFSSGAPLPKETALSIYQKFNTAVREVFGSTETGGIAWRSLPNHPTWQPFTGVRVTQDQDHRLLLRSPFLGPSTPQPYACNDRIIMQQEGFELLGRLDGVVKIAGKRIDLSYLEQCVLSLEGIRDVATLVARTNGVRAQEIWMIAATSQWTVSNLRKALLQWLDPVAIPRRIRLVDALPREENGKITRQKLHSLFSDFSRDGSYTTELEPSNFQTILENEKQTIILDIYIPSNLTFFRGHFADHPILPGAVQLQYLVIRHAQKTWPDLQKLRKITKLQFLSTIAPDSTLTVLLSRIVSEPKIYFEIRDKENKCSHGTLSFEKSASTLPTGHLHEP